MAICMSPNHAVIWHAIALLDHASLLQQRLTCEQLPPFFTGQEMAQDLLSVLFH